MIKQSLDRIKALPYSTHILILGLLLIGIAFSLNPRSENPPRATHNKHPQKDSLSESGISKQISRLNNDTPLELVYNEEVLHYINLFCNNRQDDFRDYLARAEYYFPIIETYLDRYNLPLELKYLAVVESGLNPLAKSSSGAVGIWQFLYNTSKLADLKVDSYIDERCDIYKSTDAACRYLEYLYNTFNNWELAMAAYNSGPGEVSKAIERSGGKTDYWQIRKWLPKQSVNYIPAITAVYFLFENPQYHQLSKSNTCEFLSIETDTVIVYNKLSLKHLSYLLEEIPSVIYELNPMYRQKIIPNSESGNVLVLPRKKTRLFIRNQFEFEQRSTELNKKSTKLDIDPERDSLIIYEVKPGDFFHKLAMQFYCTPKSIKEWNQISNNTLHPGQKLKIWIKKAPFN